MMIWWEHWNIHLNVGLSVALFNWFFTEDCLGRAKLSIEVSEALWHLFEEQFGQDVWQRLAVDRNAQNLTIPVILFHDRRDREVVFDESLTVSQAWSNARLIETVGLGHRRILRDKSVVQQTVDFMTTSV